MFVGGSLGYFVKKYEVSKNNKIIAFIIIGLFMSFVGYLLGVF
jgi:F0F1-type ATP synthase assembly protein I